MKKKTVKKSAVKAIAVKKCAKAKVQKVNKKNVTFTYHAEKGKNVYVAGEFNGWDPTSKKMAFKAASGVYAAIVRLEPGKSYQYKFVIDGTWCVDPANANSIPNDQGTYNSVVDVK